MKLFYCYYLLEIDLMYLEISDCNIWVRMCVIFKNLMPKSPK